MSRPGCDQTRPARSPDRVVALGLAALAFTLAVTGCAQKSASQDAAAIASGKLPTSYRDWRLISVGHEAGKQDDLRAILGNDIAVKAARAGEQPYPDGSIIARVAWQYQPLAESAQAFGKAQSFVAGAAKNGVQFMVKDSTKSASSGGWAFVQFNDGERAPDVTACFNCHQIVKARDFVFNRYAE